MRPNLLLFMFFATSLGCNDDPIRVGRTVQKTHIQVDDFEIHIAFDFVKNLSKLLENEVSIFYTLFQTRI